MKTVRHVDVVLYLWAGVFYLALCVGFPPLAFGFLVMPALHRYRVRRRNERAARRAYAAKVHWIEGGLK